MGRCAPATFGVRVAPVHDEPRSSSNKSEREPTSVRSTNYGSERLVRVLRDIGRIFSLPFLLSHPSPIGHPLRGRVQKRKRNMVSSKAKNGFNRVSCGTRRLEHKRDSIHVRAGELHDLGPLLGVGRDSSTVVFWRAEQRDTAEAGDALLDL